MSLCPTGTIRAGFTPDRHRVGRRRAGVHAQARRQTFEAQRSFATIECGKWVGAARAAFDGVVVAANLALELRPKLLNEDAFAGRLDADRAACFSQLANNLITGGAAIEAVFASWLAAEAYKDRSA